MEAGHYLIGFNAIGWPEEYIYPQQRTPGTVVEGEVTEKTFMLQGTSHLLISEVLYDTPGTDEDEEWIEIYNPTASTIDLSHYKVGDEEEQGKGEGMYQFPSGASIPHVRRSHYFGGAQYRPHGDHPPQRLHRHCRL